MDERCIYVNIIFDFCGTCTSLAPKIVITEKMFKTIMRFHKFEIHAFIDFVTAAKQGTSW